MQSDIRPARASDVDALVALENRAFATDRISRRSFRAMIPSKSAAVLVKRSGDDLAGYAVVLFRDRLKSARLYSIAADPRFAGIGHQLLAAAETEASRRGCGELRLEVRRDNLRAIALYERSGYQFRDSVENYYADGAMALRFSKPLAAKAGTVAA
jgi:ribosomal protein S18 acetylase RimI-like enzyme